MISETHEPTRHQYCVLVLDECALHYVVYDEAGVASTCSSLKIPHVYNAYEHASYQTLVGARDNRYPIFPV